jgi:PAS domain S-box-containing protein
MSAFSMLIGFIPPQGQVGSVVTIALAAFLASALITLVISHRLRCMLFQAVRCFAPLTHAAALMKSDSLSTATRKAGGIGARTVSAGGPSTSIQKRDEEMRASEQRFRQLAESIGAVFWMTDTTKSQMIYVSLGYEKIWGRTCASLYASSREWFDAIHPEDRDRVLEAVLAKQKRGDYDEEYRIVRPDGSIRWIRDRAFPVRNEAGQVYRIAGIAEDITERKLLEKEVIEISDREQRRLGQDLHDGICQQLVSIAFATDLLRRDLVAKSPHDAVRLARITALLDNAIIQARNLSHSFYPVNLVGNGLGFALRELANSISQGRRVVCEAQCAEAVLIHDHALATHLYRIAQEAVQNATKHADPSRILICLSQEGETIYLNVTDYGSATNEERNFGAGLSIMRYRASMAGGRLDIQRGPMGGTIVSVAVLTKVDARRPGGGAQAGMVGDPPDGVGDLPNPSATGEVMPCVFPEKTAYLSPEKSDTEHLADF